MTDRGIITFRIGVPGPPGEGVTAAELEGIFADITMLKDTTWRGAPIVRARSLPQPTDGNSTDFSAIPGMPLLEVSGLNPAIPHRVELVGRVKVTTSEDMIVTVATRIVSVAYGDDQQATPNDTGTFWLSCGGSHTLAAGPTAFSAVIHYMTNNPDEGASVTFDEAHLQVRVTPRTD